MWQTAVAFVLETVADSIYIETFIHFELIVLLEFLNNKIGYMISDMRVHLVESRPNYSQ